MFTRMAERSIVYALLRPDYGRTVKPVEDRGCATCLVILMLSTVVMITACIVLLAVES